MIFFARAVINYYNFPQFDSHNLRFWLKILDFFFLLSGYKLVYNMNKQ